MDQALQVEVVRWEEWVQPEHVTGAQAFFLSN